jgi:hypothetical protein
MCIHVHVNERACVVCPTPASWPEGAGSCLVLAIQQPYGLGVEAFGQSDSFCHDAPIVHASE